MKKVLSAAVSTVTMKFTILLNVSFFIFFLFLIERLRQSDVLDGGVLEIMNGHQPDECHHSTVPASPQPPVWLVIMVVSTLLTRRCSRFLYIHDVVWRLFKRDILNHALCHDILLLELAILSDLLTDNHSFALWLE